MQRTPSLSQADWLLAGVTLERRRVTVTPGPAAPCKLHATPAHPAGRGLSYGRQARAHGQRRAFNLVAEVRRRGNDSDVSL